MNFYEEWANMHAKETDEDYFKYHKKRNGELGYIPKENFFYDGILFEDKYSKSETKILFIAKECNAYEDNQLAKVEIITSNETFWARDEVKDIVEGTRPYSRFLHGLAMLGNAIINNDYTHPNKDITSLFNSAIINLNKRGGYNGCVWQTLEGYVEKYQDQIRKQIDFINPDIIVCCSKDVEDLVKKYNLSNNRITKCAYHPSYPITDKRKLYFLQNQKEMKE